jgi:membrane protein YqaA with SNARE-associated domain
VPDVLVGYAALRRGFRAGLITALLAAFGAVAGGAAMYLWSARAPDQAMAAVEAVPAVSPAMIEAADADMSRDGWLVASLKGPLTSTPYKVYAALAPAHGANLPAFAAAALPVRLPRFLAVAAVLALIGAAAKGRLPERAVIAAFTAGWVLFYGWFWFAHPG